MDYAPLEVRPPEVAPREGRPPERAARFLEAALVLNFAVHFVALAAAVMMPMPAVPGGGPGDALSRAAYVAAHPWLWRLGWGPWHLTAVAHLALSLALFRTAWVPRRPALVAAAVTLAAVAVDLAGQWQWMTRGVRLAAGAAAGDHQAYFAFDAWAFRMVAVFGCLGYLLAAAGWCWCLAAAGTWSRPLTWLAATAWGSFALAVALSLLAPASAAGQDGAGFLRFAGFLLLQSWLVAVTDRVVARSRPPASHGGYAPWRHPGPRLVARLVDRVAASHFARAVARWPPAPPLVSDARDLVYVNYLVAADRLEPLVPEGLRLQRVGPGCGFALLTCVTYRHGRVGPPLPEMLRRRLPGPVQSSWRLYVAEPASGQRGTYLISSAVGSTAHALVGRAWGECAALHVPRRADLVRDASGTVHLSVEPGGGTAPDVRATLRPNLDKALPPEWEACFHDWTGLLEFCVAEERVLSAQPWLGRVVRQEVAPAVPPQKCQRLEGVVESRTAAALVGEARPLCFYVPAARFRVQTRPHDTRLDVAAQAQAAALAAALAQSKAQSQAATRVAA